MHPHTSHLTSPLPPLTTTPGAAGGPRKSGEGGGDEGAGDNGECVRSEGVRMV